MNPKKQRRSLSDETVLNDLCLHYNKLSMISTFSMRKSLLLVSFRKAPATLGWRQAFYWCLYVLRTRVLPGETQVLDITKQTNQRKIFNSAPKSILKVKNRIHYTFLYLSLFYELAWLLHFSTKKLTFEKNNF